LTVSWAPFAKEILAGLKSRQTHFIINRESHGDKQPPMRSPELSHLKFQAPGITGGLGIPNSENLDLGRPPIFLCSIELPHPANILLILERRMVVSSGRGAESA
jgi:hypothetical protein